MENVGWAALQVIPSLKGFDSSLERGTSGPLAHAGVTGGAKFGDAAGRTAASSMRSHLTRAAGFIIGGFIGAEAIRKTGDLIRNSLDEARDSQKVARVTEARIKSTGGAANLTAKQIGRLSTALSNKVGIDDEVIQRGANMLLTFKNVRQGVGKQNDIFTQATSVTTDLAASMAGGHGGEPDLKNASILVGKALNDPIKGLTSLTRVGVTFSDGQKKQIESLVKSGDTMKAQKIILKELNSEFGGTAKAQATTADKLKVAFGNVEESLGKKLLPLVHDFQDFLLKKGIPAAEDFVQWFGKEGAPKIKSFVDSAKPLAHSILPAVGTGLKDVAHFMKQAAGPAKSVFDAFNSLPSWAQKAIVVGGAAGVLAKKSGILGSTGNPLTGSSSSGVLGLISKSKPIPVFVTNPGALGGVEGAAAAGGNSTFGKLGTLAGGTLATGILNDVADSAFKKEFGSKLGNAVGDSFRGVFHLPDPSTKLAGPTLFKNIFGGDSEPSKPPIFLKILAADAKAAESAIAGTLQPLQQASRGLDIVSRGGSQAFGGLSNKIDGTSSRTDILDRKLRGLPKSLHTELALDDREARRRLAAFQREAQKSLSLELAGPHMGRPGQSLDGVRRGG